MAAAIEDCERLVVRSAVGGFRLDAELLKRRAGDCHFIFDD